LAEGADRSRVYAVVAWVVVPMVTILFEKFWQVVVTELLHVASNALQTLVLALVLMVTVHYTFKVVPNYRRTRMLAVGFVWALLFVVFDVSYRYYGLGVSIDAITLDYNPFMGGLRFYYLLVIFVCPILFVRTLEGDPDLFSMPIGKMATIGLLPSSLKIRYYRRRGAQIGKDVSIGLLAILDCKKIVIGNHVKIGAACLIRCNELEIGSYSTLGMMVIIDTCRVRIGEEVTIQEQVYIGGLKTDKSYIEIGDLSMVFAQSVLNPTHPIKIGKRVGIGGSNFLFTHGTWQPILKGFPVAFGPITIDDGVWFPWRVFVLPNVHVGEEATIGAGSVINRDIPARSLAAGVPAVVKRAGNQYIKEYTDEEKRSILKDMLSEMVGYLSTEGWPVSDPVFEEAFVIASFRTPHGPSSKHDNHVVFMFEKSTPAFEMVKEWTYVVSLVPVDEERALELEKMGCWWFDLENSTWGGTRTNVSRVVWMWLSRYGHWLKYTPLYDRSKRD
jgi:acetyltransferase-like isoleucine patch superfamily enzyme